MTAVLCALLLCVDDEPSHKYSVLCCGFSVAWLIKSPQLVSIHDCSFSHYTLHTAYGTRQTTVRQSWWILSLPTYQLNSIGCARIMPISGTYWNRSFMIVCIVPLRKLEAALFRRDWLKTIYRLFLHCLLASDQISWKWFSRWQNAWLNFSIFWHVSIIENYTGSG